MNKIVINSLGALNPDRPPGVNVSSSVPIRMAMLSSVRVRGTTSGGNNPLVDGVYSDVATLNSIYPR